MSDRHWSEEALIDKLYGLSPENDEHLGMCPACSRRWDEIRARHAERVAVTPDVPESLLAQQRMAVHQRLEQVRPVWLRLAPAMAATALIALLAAVLFRPAPQVPTQEPSADAAVLEEVFEVSSSSEPSSIEPVKSLFEVTQ